MSTAGVARATTRQVGNGSMWSRKKLATKSMTGQTGRSPEGSAARAFAQQM